MNENIISNLNYFSEITQRTLSAFHFSGTDSTLEDEVEELKRFVSKNRFKKLIKIDILDDNRYCRHFSDGSKDIVDEEDINTKVAYEKNELFEVIDRALSKDISPIMSIKLSRNIQLVENKKIENPSEKIFFL